jgi:hypothetical protein
VLIPGDPGARGREDVECEEVENWCWRGEGESGAEDVVEPPVRVEEGEVGARRWGEFELGER